MSVNELAVAAKNGDGKAFSVLLKRMEGAINKVVSRYAVGDGASYREEYIQEAICGLYNCLESYDEEKGAFVSYASYAMDVQIKDFIRNRQSQITIGTNMLNNVQKVRRAIEEIREDGLEESIENISLYSGIESHKTVKSALMAMRVEKCGSLDENVKNGEETTFAQLVSSEERLEEAFLEREEERALYRIVASLPERDRFIALHSYGIFGRREMSNLEIAERLGCTPNTVVNRKKAITARIREALMEWAS